MPDHLLIAVYSQTQNRKYPQCERQSARRIHRHEIPGSKAVFSKVAPGSGLRLVLHQVILDEYNHSPCQPSHSSNLVSDPTAPVNDDYYAEHHGLSAARSVASDLNAGLNHLHFETHN